MYMNENNNEQCCLQFYNFYFLGTATTEIYNYKWFHYKDPINVIQYVTFFLTEQAQIREIIY